MRGTKAILGKYRLPMMLFLCMVILGMPLAYAEEAKKELPPREIIVVPEYPSVVVPEEEDVSIDMVVRNGGRQGEMIELTIPSVPKGWKAWFKTYSFKIGGLCKGLRPGSAAKCPEGEASGRVFAGECGLLPGYGCGAKHGLHCRPQWDGQE